MNPVTFAKIAIKIVAVYLMAQGIMQVPSIISLFQFSSTPMGENAQVIFVLVSAIFMPLIAGILLWAISNWLSRYIVAGVPQDESANNSLPHIQAVAISTVGLIVVVLSLPQLISLAVQLFGHTSVLNDEKVFSTAILSSFVASCVKVVLGLALVLGASGWVKLLYKIRGLGLK